MAIVGIDLGTTFSAIAVLDDIGNPEVVASIDNDRITPSVVYISAENKIYVGDKAKNAGRADKKGVIKEVKRKMPQTDTVYDITQGKWMNGQSDNKTKFSPSDISSAILRKLKKEGCDILTVEKKNLNLLNQIETESWIKKYEPKIIILAAAKVGGIKFNMLNKASFLYENLMIQNNVIHSASKLNVDQKLNSDDFSESSGLRDLPVAVAL